MATFTAHSIPDLTGKTAIVTGASSGIGLAVARALATTGARVVFAVRNTAKGRVAADATPGLTEVRQLDLASLDSVRAFAAGWEDPIDLLINNAGVSAPIRPCRPRTWTCGSCGTSPSSPSDGTSVAPPPNSAWPSPP